MPKEHVIKYKASYLIAVSKLCALIACTPLLSALYANSALPILQLRGIFHTPTNGWEFSIHEVETGCATWVRMHQERNGYYVEDYDAITKTVIIRWNGEHIQLPMRQSDGRPLVLQFSPLSLSPYNQELFAQHKQLIRTNIPRSGNPEEIQEARIQAFEQREALSHLLKTNPSIEEFNKHIGELGESFDYASFMQIDAPKGVESRNKHNTAGWGIKKNVDMKELEVALSNNASISQINDMIRAQ